nr:MAG TPA: zinc finger protein [Caudoviricetes sp.]
MNTQGDCCYIPKVPALSIYFCLRWSDCDRVFPTPS